MMSICNCACSLVPALIQSVMSSAVTPAYSLESDTANLEASVDDTVASFSIASASLRFKPRGLFHVASPTPCGVEIVDAIDAVELRDRRAMMTRHDRGASLSHRVVRVRV